MSLVRWLRRNPVCAAIVLLGVFLRLFWLTRQSLWSDEAVTLAACRWPDLLGSVRALEIMPPLHTLLMRPWLFFWSDPAAGLRSFSALCGAACLPVFWLFCRRLLPGQALLALFLAAAASPWVHAAQNGRPYALVLLLACLQAALAWELRSSWSGRKALAYAAAAVCGLYTHYFYHFLVLSLGLSLLLEPGFRSRRIKAWLGLHALVWLCFQPWLPSIFAQMRHSLAASVINEPLSPGLLARIFGTFLFDPGYLGLALPGATAAAGCAALALAAAGLWRHRQGAQRDAVRFCLVNILIVLAAAAAAELLAGRPVCQPRHFLYLTVFFYPLLALAADGRILRPGLAAAVLAGTCAYYASALAFDARLPALAEQIRVSSDRREPVVHWGALDYPSLRYGYLPQRAHFLLTFDPAEAAWHARLPGYAGVVRPGLLARWPRCVVVDPLRRAFPKRVSVMSGQQLLGLAIPGTRYLIPKDKHRR